MLLNVALLLIIIFLLLVLSFVWPPDSPWAPWWRTQDREIRESLKLAKVTKKDVVYDLGCGDGRVIILAAKEFGARGVGIEIDPLRFLISAIMIRIIRVGDKATIKRKNFFDEDISKASVVFVYLVPKALQRLLPKLLKELKPGTKIISYRYEIDLPLIAKDRKKRISVYKIPKNPNSISEAKFG